MGKNGALTLHDIAGKLSILRVSCTRCDRQGQYLVAKLIERYGLDKSLAEWKDEVASDCPKIKSGQVYDRCGAMMPDLSALCF